jgi:hypothetical protein
MIKAIIIVRNKVDIVGLIFNPFDVILIRPHATRAPAFLNKII